MSASPETRVRCGAPWVFLFFLSLFALTSSGFDSSEAAFHFAVARQLLTTGGIAFPDPVENITAIQGTDGRYYSSHEIGNALFFIPTVALESVASRCLRGAGVRTDRVDLGSFLRSFQAGLYSAVTAMVFYLILAAHYGLSRRAAFCGAVSLALTSYFWTYSRIAFDGVLCSTFLVLSVYLLLCYSRSGNLVTLAFSVFFLGLCLITRISLVLAIPATLAFLAVTHQRNLRALGVALVVGAVVLAPFLAFQLWYNNLRTGSPFALAVQAPRYAHQNTLDGPIGLGLVGLIISPGKGLFVYAPLVLLSVLLFPRFAGRSPALACYLVVLVVPYLLIHARLRAWYGSWGWGPRQLVTLVPLLFLPVGVMTPVAWRSLPYRLLYLFLATWGLVLSTSSILGSYHYRLAYAFQNGTIGDDQFVWALRTSQSLDMVEAAGRNLNVCFGVGAPCRVQGASELNTYASNTINVWENTLTHAGFSLWLVSLPAALLVFTLVLALFRLMRSPPPGVL